MVKYTKTSPRSIAKAQNLSAPEPQLRKETFRQQSHDLVWEAFIDHHGRLPPHRRRLKIGNKNENGIGPICKLIQRGNKPSHLGQTASGKRCEVPLLPANAREPFPPQTIPVQATCTRCRKQSWSPPAMGVNTTGGQMERGADRQ